ncbi:MAG TPA: YbdK family carboxylate-amine ligase [Longimicrobium sp.]|jgi:carboxylate-amine ligase|uniref:carboxylate-amine ligase n=1 Tax=Longimicrobium sp. TaxID=2029185 RepID=UPI002ED86089
MAAGAQYTVGVEEEYQLVDARSAELRSRARYVIATDWADELKAEMQEHTVEVETRVCEGTDCVRDDLARLRFTAAIAAEAEGTRIVAAGTHPFSPAEGHAFNPAPVYQQLRADYRRLAESQAIFGMHVHVGLPPGTDRARVCNVVRLHLPVLLALSASSPLWLGGDTGHASYRSILWRRWPRSGAPPRFSSDAEYAELVRWMVESGRIDGPGRLYWELRPHHVYPTVEIRVADCTPRLQDAVLVASLARVVVAGAAEGVLAESPLPESFLQPLLSDNGWRASRHGIAAELADLEGTEPRTLTVADAALRLAERLSGVAAELGEAEELARLPALLREGGAADAIRARAASLGGDLAAVTHWLADETVMGVGMDRRARLRLEETV